MIRVLLVDDEALVRAGLRLILRPLEDIEVVAEAGNGREAVETCRRRLVDVVLMDVRMPVLDGIAATAEIVKLPAAPKIVMLTTFDLDELVHRALRAGAVGFLLKDSPPARLADAVRTVAAGGAMLAPIVTKRLIDTFAAAPDKAGPARRLLARVTDREREVLLAVARGLSNNEIARELVMSEATVKAHVSRALTKLGMTNRVQAAILVHEAGLS